jgi:hypothetical protein
LIRIVHRVFRRKTLIVEIGSTLIPSNWRELYNKAMANAAVVSAGRSVSATPSSLELIGLVLEIRLLEIIQLHAAE